MSLSSACLPENLLKCMDKTQRAPMGKSGLTYPEREKAIDAKSEKKLQGLIGQYLRQKGIEFICPPMNKRSALPTGWSDYTFVYRGIPFALEIKVGRNQQTPEQHEMQSRLELNGWNYKVIRELDEVRTILRTVEEME